MISMHCAGCLNTFFISNEIEFDPSAQTYNILRYLTNNLFVTVENIVKCSECKHIVGETENKAVLKFSRQNLIVYASDITRNVGSN